ncbi:MAG: thiol:disulfide interchange protein, partial [Bacteroidaceae bacterium]|nr:thiol:disulfide interchange protein [Bacteroidaceae bacterium]
MRRIITTIMLLLGIMIPTIAQIKSPVKFAVKQKQVSEREFDVIFSGTISNGWHVYSTGLPDDGPVSASFHLEDSRNVKAVGRLKPEGNEIKKYEDLFGM